MHRTSITAVAATAALCLTPLASAGLGTLEFEDLISGTSYPNGSSFVTEGTTVNVTDFFFLNGSSFSGGSAEVFNPNLAGAGNGIFMGNVNLDFQFALPVTIIGFAYANQGGNVNLSVNGSLYNDNDMSGADGTVLGGANVSVSGDEQGGFVTIQGNITQFAVGGQEFTLDDVRCVPTPGAASLVALGALAGARRRRR